MSFLGISLILGAIKPGYSQWRNFVSQLTWGKQGWIQIANFVVSGALLVAFAIGLARKRVAAPGANRTPALMAVVGGSLVVDGIFVADPGLGYPPDVPSPGVLTPHGRVHVLAALVAFASTAGMCFQMRDNNMIADRHREWWGKYSVATGVLGPVLWAASLVTGWLDASGVVPNAPNGLLNRLAILVAVGWIEVLAVLALRADRDRGHALVGGGPNS